MESIEIRNLDIELSPYAEYDEDFPSYQVEGYIEVNSPSHILGKEGKRKWREVIAPDVFRNALAKAERLGQSIDFLDEHDNKKVLASTSNGSLFLEEDEVGLFIRAKISETSWGKDLFVLVKDRIITGLSFGMKVLRDDWSVTPDGMALRTILEIDLFEVSALRKPAYPMTLLESRGLDVTLSDSIEVPEGIDTKESKDVEKRAFNSVEEEVTPLMMYNGMVLIAEKLDEIVLKMDSIDQDKTIKGLEDAKNILVETKALVEATSGKSTVEDNPEDNPDETDETRAAKNDQAEDVNPDDPTDPVNGETPKADETEDEDPETEDQKDSEEGTDDELTEEEKQKLKEKNEIRSWLNENKIVEVPENE